MSTSGPDPDIQRGPQGRGPFRIRHVGALVLATAVFAGATLVLTYPVQRVDPTVPLPSAYDMGGEVGALGIGARAPTLPADLIDVVSGLPIGDLGGDGSALWLTFSATWCPPCQAELPVLQDWADRYPERLRLATVAIRDVGMSDVKRYYADHGVTFPVVYGVGQDLEATWGVPGLPTHYFIDADGVVRARIIGPATDETVAAIITAILSMSASEDPGSPD